MKVGSSGGEYGACVPHSIVLDLPLLTGGAASAKTAIGRQSVSAGASAITTIAT